MEHRSSFEEELTAQVMGGQPLYSLQLSAASSSASPVGTVLPKVTSFEGCQDMVTEGKWTITDWPFQPDAGDSVDS